MNNHVTYHLSITGLVQGVYYRSSMVQEALRLGLDGWVRNCRDGSVEAVVSGPQAKVQELVAWARQGPPAARVAGITMEPWNGSINPGFDQFPTT